MKYTECVADAEEALVHLSKIANVDFTSSEFSKFEDDFSDSGKDVDFYMLKGMELEISVKLEKYEGYLYISISGSGDCFNAAKNYLSRCR